jgi:hypothetical protein
MFFIQNAWISNKLLKYEEKNDEERRKHKTVKIRNVTKEGRMI